MWDLIGDVSNIIQIVSIFPWLFTAYLFWNRAKKYRELMKKQEGTTSQKPKALAIGLVGTGDISNQVAQFLKDQSLQMEIEPFYIKPGTGITKDNIQKLLREILEIKTKLTSEGVTEVHLFLAAPVAFGAAIGALLDNWVPVKVYQSVKTGGYEFWTILHKGYIPGVDSSLLKEVMDPEL
jgi:hypothetical protein